MSKNPPMVSALGGARRLQALGCAGYGAGYLAELMVAHRLHVRAWQRHEHSRIRLTTHERIDYTYQHLWQVDGPSTLARIYSQQRGWMPPEAWTENTIDDPTAKPYSDPDAALYVDEVLLARVRSGQRRYLDLNGAEKICLLVEHLSAGGTMRGFRNRYRPVPKRELERLIVQHPYMHPLLRPQELPATLRPEEDRVEYPLAS